MTFFAKNIENKTQNEFWVYDFYKQVEMGCEQNQTIDLF